MDEYYRREVGEEWLTLRNRAMRLLQEEAELEEIVRLVGVDALSDHDSWSEIARSIREDFYTRMPSMKLTPTPPYQTIQFSVW